MTELYTLIYSSLDRAEIPQICGVFDSLEKVSKYISSISHHYIDNYYLYRNLCNESIEINNLCTENALVYKLTHIPGVNIMFNVKN